MKRVPFIFLTILSLLIVACDGDGSTNSTFVHWESEVLVSSQNKEELQRYFDVLDAKTVRVEVMYEDENFDEYLHVGIEDSRFFDEEKSASELDVASKRLAHLVQERIDDIDSYIYLRITHSTDSDRLQSFDQVYDFESLP